MNPTLEYFKAKQRTLLSESKTGEIYGQRKIDVEPAFGWMKACLHFTLPCSRTGEGEERNGYSHHGAKHEETSGNEASKSLTYIEK